MRIIFAAALILSLGACKGSEETKGPAGSASAPAPLAQRIVGNWSSSALAIGNRPLEQIEYRFSADGKANLLLVSQGTPRRVFGGADGTYTVAGDVASISLVTKSPPFASVASIEVRPSDLGFEVVTAKGQFPLASFR